MLGSVRPGATAHRGDGLPQTMPRQPPELRPAGSAHWPKRSGRSARHDVARALGVVTAPASTSGWHRRCDLADGLGVATVAALAPMEKGVGAGQGGRGRSSPKRRRGVETVEDASGGGVQWRRGSSDNE
jgi:hypothetical protein